jgi:alpha-beta hydrolase superfamily lysophospholipase
LLVVLPGHGKQLVKNRELIEDVPTGQNWKKEYGSLVEGVNSVMEMAGGEKHVAGLSVGGALALWSMLDRPQLYDRALLYAPCLGVSGEHVTGKDALSSSIRALRGSLVNAAGATPLGLYTLDWGKGCFTTERDLGRAGNCSYTVSQIAGAQAMGDFLMKRLKATAADAIPKTQVQWVAVQADKAIDDDRLVAAPSLMPSLSSQFCMFPQGVNHSMLSRKDAPQEEKFWVDGVLNSSVNFLSRGRGFPQVSQLLDGRVTQCSLCD